MDDKPKLYPQCAADLLAKPPEEIEWLIENVWVAESRGMIAGDPKIGKTWLALDMLLSVATGQSCLGQFAVKQAPVLLVEEEGSVVGLTRRIHGLARARGFKESDLASFYHLTRKFVRVPEDMSEIFSFVFSIGVKLVVFDSLRRFHMGNENRSEEMQKVLDSFGKLSSMGNCSVVLVHHLSKESRETAGKNVFERLRGTGDFWAWCDCLIGMEGQDEADTAKCSFQFRDAEAPEPIMVKRSIGDLTGAVGLEIVDIADSEEFEERAELILAYVKSQYGPVSRNQICENVKGRKIEIIRAIKLMVQRKLLAMEGIKLVVPEPAGTGSQNGPNV